MGPLQKALGVKRKWNWGWEMELVALERMDDF